MFPHTLITQIKTKNYVNSNISKKITKKQLHYKNPIAASSGGAKLFCVVPKLYFPNTPTHIPAHTTKSQIIDFLERLLEKKNKFSTIES